MASKTITLSLTDPSEGSAWTAEFTADDATPIKNIVGFSWSMVTPDSSGLFTVSSVDGYDGSGVQYVTWRSTSPSEQHPTSGYSVDIWQQTFYENIINFSGGTGMTWDEMLTGNGSGGNTYSLSTDKWSLVYDYSNLNAISFSKGGTLTVTAV